MQYDLQGSETVGIPTTMDFAELEEGTIKYLQDTIKMMYDAEDDVYFDSIMIEATARRTGGGEGKSPFIDYEASVAFDTNSPVIPEPDDIGKMVAHLMSGRNLATYLFTLAQHLSDDNPFRSTTMVTVFIPDPASTNNRISSRTAGSIAAAACAGVFTLAVAGYVVYKVREENLEGGGGGGGKFKFTGGVTLAGDTCGTSTVTPSILHHDGVQSVTAESYSDDQSSVTSPTMAFGHGNATVGENQKSSSKIQAKWSTKTNGSTSRSLVPVKKPVSPLNSKEIQNYFKAKYKCASPRGYQSVDKSPGAIDEAIQEITSEEEEEEEYDDEDRPETTRFGLEMPALDHISVDPSQMSNIPEEQLIMVEEEELVEEEVVEHDGIMDPPELMDETMQIQQQYGQNASFEEETVESGDEREEFLNEDDEMEVISENDDEGSTSSSSPVHVYVNSSSSSSPHNLSPLTYHAPKDDDDDDNVSFGKAAPDDYSVGSLN